MTYAKLISETAIDRNPPRRAFCIVSADGRKRTNLEEAK